MRIPGRGHVIRYVFVAAVVLFAGFASPWARATVAPVPATATLLVAGASAGISALTGLPAADVPEPTEIAASHLVGVDDNGDARAGALARTELAQVLTHLTAGAVARLGAQHLRLDLIPVGVRLTDLHDFSFLRGVTLSYGRPYDDVRGVGAVTSGRATVFAVGEEELAGQGAYGAGFELTHETGHVIRHFGLSVAQDRALGAAYSEHRAAAGPWLAPASYTAVNDDEYFAQSVAAYFNAPYSRTDPTYNRSWLAVNDPPMSALLATVFPGA